MRLSLCSLPRSLLLCSVAVGAAALFQSQAASGQTTPPPANALVSLPAKANVILPNATVSIDYCAPSMRGRTIFGGLVPYGEVWRTGANAATTLKTTGALQIGDLNVPAGTYTLYSLPTADGWTLIVNKQTGQWGTVYDKAQDLGRVQMSAGSTAVPVETFVIDFEKTIGQTTELHLKWAGVDASVGITAVK
jgi:Protein of unknown function (DUF2911)